MTLADRSAAAAIRLIWQLAAALPPERASALGAALLGRAGPWIRKHRMVRDNLRTAFPEWPERMIEATARASWAELGRVIAEFPHFATLMAPGPAPEPALGRGSKATLDVVRQRVELADETGLFARAAGGRPIIIAGGHFANWELLAGVAVRAGVPLTVVHAARANPLIETLVERHRRALGCSFIEQGESVLAMRRHIRAGRSIGVLVDQRYNEGEPVPLFGRPAMTALAPALLAVRFDLPFVPIRAERLADCRFRITVEPALEPDSSLVTPRAIAHDLMTRLHGRFEAWIRERPEQWLCIKRRWPRLAGQTTHIHTSGATPADLPPHPVGAATLDDALVQRRKAG